MLTTFGAALIPYLIHSAAPTAYGTATGDFWGVGMTAVGALTTGRSEQTLLQILNWMFYILQSAMSIWLLILLTRLYRLNSGNAESEHWRTSSLQVFEPNAS